MPRLQPATRQPTAGAGWWLRPAPCASATAYSSGMPDGPPPHGCDGSQWLPIGVEHIPSAAPAAVRKGLRLV